LGTAHALANDGQLLKSRQDVAVGHQVARFQDHHLGGQFIQERAYEFVLFRHR
jgi:hypothetical protein